MNQNFYKDLIYMGFYPNRNASQPNFESAKKAVDNYQNVADSTSDLIEMMLYYVEVGSDFMSEFGGIPDDVCIDLEETFEEALKKIAENNLQSDFEIRCREIVKNANDGFGFYDSLQSSFEMYLGD